MPIPIELMNQKESAMVIGVNERRAFAGLYPYKTSIDLYHQAQGRAYYMHEVGALTHYGFYPAYLESGAIYFGESISYNFITPEANLTAFQNSQYHWPMFISPIYEYIAIACYNNYTVVLVARWRPYNSNGKREFEIIPINTRNISTTEIQK